MTIMIGIRQQAETNEPLAASPALKSGQILSAGPFASRLQAQSWQQYVQRRCGGLVFPCPEAETTAPWYGFIINQEATDN